jgi:hypothetical protein
VLGIVPRTLRSPATLSAAEVALTRWALSSGEEELEQDFPRRGILEESTQHLLDIRLCRNIFQRPRGNRSCFDKCK